MADFKFQGERYAREFPQTLEAALTGAPDMPAALVAFKKRRTQNASQNHGVYVITSQSSSSSSVTFFTRYSRMFRPLTSWKWKIFLQMGCT